MITQILIQRIPDVYSFQFWPKWISIIYKSVTTDLFILRNTYLHAVLFHMGLMKKILVSIQQLFSVTLSCAVIVTSLA